MDVVLGVDVIRFPLTGIGRYAYELGLGLAKNPEVERLLFLSGARLVQALPRADVPCLERSAGRWQRILGRAAVRSQSLLGLRRWVNDCIKARVLRDVGSAIYHGPNFYLPEHSGPRVATFHDISVVRHPEFHPTERVRYMLNELPVALKRADVLVTISEHARRELIAYSGFAPERVLSVPLAASDEFHPRLAGECSAVLRQHGLEYGNYVLFAGTVEPRKNLARLLDAYERMPSRLRKHMPLVVAGYSGWCSDDLHIRLQVAQAAGWVRYLGYVTAADLPVLFAGARVFVFPSIYEGFGLPVLEAMASGVPVVCSDATSLPEVAGGHALMCPPEDMEGLHNLLERAIEDENWRDSAILGGLQHARSFSWERTVSGTLQAYRLAMKSRDAR